MAGKNTEAYSSRLHTGSRTYFFDIERGASGDLRLEITESRKRGGAFERDRVMVFQEDVSRFVEELMRAVSAMPEVRAAPEPARQQQARYDVIRRTHPRAYEPWSADEDKRLLDELEQGCPVSQMAKNHGRQPNAIRSRIQRLGG